MLLDQIIFAVLVGLYLAFAWPPFVARLRTFANCRRNASVLVWVLLVPFAPLAWSSGGSPGAFLDALGGMSLYLLVPMVATLYRPKDAPALHPLDVVTILALWFPIEFGWLPDAPIQLAADIRLPGEMFIGILLGLVLFLVARPLPGIGYTFRLTRADARTISLGLGFYTLVGIPFGLLTRFLVPGLAPFGLVDWLLSWLLGYLFTALPEELLFRGIIQNQIHARLRREWLALAVAAVIFGLSHLNNSTLNYAEPNWMYAGMATLAGLAYGYTWRRSGKITASAVVHATVNFVWGILLQGG